MAPGADSPLRGAILSIGLNRLRLKTISAPSEIARAYLQKSIQPLGTFRPLLVI